MNYEIFRSESIMTTNDLAQTESHNQMITFLNYKIIKIKLLGVRSLLGTLLF